MAVTPDGAGAQLGSGPLRAAVRRLRRDVAALATDEGRVVGGAGHAKAAALLERWLSERGLAPYRGSTPRLEYRSGAMHGVNLAGVVAGRDRSLPPLLLAAHYDSVLHSPCADDNAAAVAISFEIAASLADGAAEPLQRDLVVLLFDAEEPPYTGTDRMGSIAFYHQQMDARGVHALVVQDLTGHQVGMPSGGRELRLPLIRHLVFAMGAESHPALAAVLAGMPRHRALRLVAAPNRHVGDVSDHLIFRRQAVPYLFFSCGRWRHYHQPTDTPDRLDYRKMARLARHLTALVRGLDRTQLPRRGPPGIAGPPTYEEATVDMELTLMRRAFGPYLPLLLRRAGVSRLRGRADLELIAKKLVGGGL